MLLRATLEARLDNMTRLALQAIVRGLHRSGAIPTESVLAVVDALQAAAALRHDALDGQGARELAALADCMERDADAA